MTLRLSGQGGKSLIFLCVEESSSFVVSSLVGSRSFVPRSWFLAKQGLKPQARGGQVEVEVDGQGQGVGHFVLRHLVLGHTRRWQGPSGAEKAADSLRLTADGVE